MDAQILISFKAISEAAKIESFNGNNFKRWQQKIQPILEFANISFVLSEPKLEAKSENSTKWEIANKLCLHTILNTLSNELFDVYSHFKCASNLQEELVGRYVFEDEGTKKFASTNFLHFQMTNEKSVSSQIIEFHNLVFELTKEGNVLLERFVTHSLVDKLLNSWKEYKLQYTHNRTYLSLQQTIVDTKIEERNKKFERESSAKELALKANIVEIRPFKPPQFHKKK